MTSIPGFLKNKIHELKDQKNIVIRAFDSYRRAAQDVRDLFKRGAG
jgi:hypothetical protein